MEEQFIINGLTARNKIIFDFVFHYYYSGLCAYTEKITNDEKVAEDIVQDLFVALWMKAGALNIASSVKNYLFTSVRNRAFDYLRSESRKSKKTGNPYQSVEPAENLSMYWFAESELETVVETSLQKLQPRCREVFELSRFEGMKNHEIAEKLGISKRTVELQVSNALKQLRTDLKDFLPIFLLMYLLK